VTVRANSSCSFAPSDPGGAPDEIECRHAAQICDASKNCRIRAVPTSLAAPKPNVRSQGVQIAFALDELA
jgi:hypothetical protein